MESSENTDRNDHPLPGLDPAELHEIAERAHEIGIESASPTVDATTGSDPYEHQLPNLKPAELHDVEAGAYDAETDLALPHTDALDPAVTLTPFAGQLTPPQVEAAYDLERDTGI